MWKDLSSSMGTQTLLCFIVFLSLSVSLNSSRPPFACDQSDPATRWLDFCKASLPVEARARDLVARLTLDEKVSQLVNSAAGVPRLGIPAYEWWSESLHGVSGSGKGIHFNGSIRAATSFPQVILPSASFNDIHWYQIGQAIGIEARALYNAGQSSGMTFWAPNINIFRDPRWGRGQETPGEDPLLTGRYAAAYVRGVQGAPPQGDARVASLRASACCKHFTAYDLDSWRGTTRFVFNAINLTKNTAPDRTLGTREVTLREGHQDFCQQKINPMILALSTQFDSPKPLKRQQVAFLVIKRSTTTNEFVIFFTIFTTMVSKQDLADTYQPPFQTCVENGQASGIMCSYNRINGVPACADYDLLSATARAQWGFNGYITSDCDAVSIIHDVQGYAATPEDAVADVLKAGMDVNCGSYLLQHTTSAVQWGKLKEPDLDRALHNLFSVRMRLGLFDGDPARLPFGTIGWNQVCSESHKTLALEAARDGLVLFKNSAGLLPFRRAQVRSLAVIGPNANDAKVLQGNYYGPPCFTETPLDALRRYATYVRYEPGCDSVACWNDGLVAQAVSASRNVDRVVLMVGLDQTQEREEKDRESLLLPGHQQRLVESAAAAARSPVVLVILSGGPVDVSFAKYNNKIGAIVWAGYPGQAGGLALAQVIFGEHNPGGRLPMSWYPESYTRIPMTDMRMRPAAGYPGRTYRFYNGREVYRFGYGLSYSAYQYEFISVTNRLWNLSGGPSSIQTDSASTPEKHYHDIAKIGRESCDQMRFTATVGVSNNGTMSGRHAVLLFSRADSSPPGSPKRQLVGFQSVHLRSGERVELEFVLEPCTHLSRAMEDGTKVVHGGAHYLIVGGTQHQFKFVS